VEQILPLSDPNMYFTLLQSGSMIMCNGELCCSRWQYELVGAGITETGVPQNNLIHSTDK
jgi:hypothetical protein